MKKSLTIILTLLTFLSCCAVFGSAATTRNFTFDAKNYVTNYVCTKREIKINEYAKRINEYTYDANNRLTTQTEKTIYSGSAISDVTTAYTYNKLGQLEKKTESDKFYGDETTTCTYNKNGYLIKMIETDEDGDSVYTYSYDKNNKITKCVITCGGSIQSYDYKYNAQGSIIEKNYTTSGIENIYVYAVKYDETGAVTQVTQSCKTDTDIPTKTYNIKYKNGLLSEYGIDNRIQKITCRADGRITKQVITDAANNTTETHNYTYDENGNLTHVGPDGNVFDYEYKKTAKAYVNVTVFGINVIMPAASYNYTGEAITPDIDIQGLTEGINYKVYYSNNVNPGKGEAKIIFLDGYETMPIATITFDIVGKTPAQVTGLKTSSVKNTSVGLTWSKAANAKYYKVEKSLDGKKWSTASTVTATALTVKSLKANTKYYFRVTGLDSTKKISGKASAAVTVRTLTTPAQVTGLKASSVKSTSIGLTWSKAANAKYYKVEKSLDGKKWSTVGTVTATALTVKSLKANTKYYFRVTGLDSTKKISGKASAAVTVRTLTAASTVTLKSAKSKTATATWKKVDGATKYVVYKSTDGKKFTKLCETQKLTYTLTKLTGGKTVYVKITAVNSAGKASAYSNVAKVTVKK